MLSGDRFQLVRINLETRDQDHVLLTVNDTKVTLLVHGPDIAGMQPSLAVDDAGSLLGLLPVAGHDLRAADTEFAGLTDSQGPPVLTLDGAFGGRDRQADRAAMLGRRGRINADRGRC